jgi:hypothetical protein
VKTSAGPIEYKSDQRSRLSRFDEEEDAVDEEDGEVRRELELGLRGASLNVT